MYCVYWQECHEDKMYPRQQMIEELEKALTTMQTLRNRTDVRFVAYAIENVEMVGQFGVADIGPDYNWTKRRTIALRSDK